MTFFENAAMETLHIAKQLTAACVLDLMTYCKYFIEQSLKKELKLGVHLNVEKIKFNGNFTSISGSFVL